MRHDQADEERRRWRKIFREVIARYNATRSKYTHVSMESFYAGLQRDAPQSSDNPNIVAPSESDFICDVEIAARRGLRESEYEYFLDVYVNMIEMPKRNMNRRVAAKLGRLFLQRGIYPVDSYFAPSEVEKR